MTEQFTAEEEAALSNITSDDNLGKPVRVRWIDSGLSLHRWLNKDDVEEKTKDMLSPVETVGLWMGENETVVMVGQSRDAEHANWMSAFLIWKPSIQAVEWLS
jgi:hypothetical protein